jgi:trigger factor
VRSEVEQKLIGELRDEMAIVLPDTLVEGEMEATLHRFAHRLSAQGISIEQYLEITGQDQKAFVEDLRQQGTLNLLTRILLEGVARAEGLEVSDAELDEAVEELAAAAETTPEEYRRVLREGAQEKALAGDILTRKAIDRLLELAVAVDTEGNEIEFDEPEARSGGQDEETPDVGGESAASDDEE